MAKKKKLENHKLKKIAEKFGKSEFFFDDCPICRAMKEAEDREKGLSLDELELVFKEANKKQKRQRK